jgi:hypothetical protein
VGVGREGDLSRSGGVSNSIAASINSAFSISASSQDRKQSVQLHPSPCKYFSGLGYTTPDAVFEDQINI